MKKILLLLTLITSQMIYADKGESFSCVSKGLRGDILTLTQVSNDLYKGIGSKCNKHSVIQFDWEMFSYFQVNLNGKSLSGVGCSEDVNFEFKSSTKYFGDDVTVWMYLDELEESTMKIGDKEYELVCEMLFDL